MVDEITDIIKLTKFLDMVAKDLKEIINRYMLLVPEHQTYHNQLMEGFPEILEKIKMSQNWLNNKKPVKSLKEHGLLGYQLRLKLEMVKIAREQNQIASDTHNRVSERYGTNEKTIDVGVFDRIRSPFRNLERKLKVNLLTVFCTILGSLSDIIPGLGAVNEFKDVLKDSLAIKN